MNKNRQSVVVVQYARSGDILKVCSDWDVADSWVESSKYSEDDVNMVEGLIFEG